MTANNDWERAYLRWRESAAPASEAVAFKAGWEAAKACSRSGMGESYGCAPVPRSTPARRGTCADCHWWGSDGGISVCTADAGHMPMRPSNSCPGWQPDRRSVRSCDTCRHWWENMKAHMCVCASSPFHGRATGAKESCVAWDKELGSR